MKAGQIFAASDGVGLAMLKLEVLDQILSEGVELVAEETTLNVRKPSWFENTN